jgi:hypothetical protein
MGRINVMTMADLFAYLYEEVDIPGLLKIHNEIRRMIDERGGIQVRGSPASKGGGDPDGKALVQGD